MVVVSIPELKARKGWDEAYTGSWQTCSEAGCRQSEGQTCSGAAWRQSEGKVCEVKDKVFMPLMRPADEQYKGRRGPECLLSRFPFFRSPADEKCLSWNKLCLEDLAKDERGILESPTIMVWGPLWSFMAFSVCFIKLEAPVSGVSMFTIVFFAS